MEKLTLDDIADLREYEKIREQFRNDIIEMKKHRRIPLGPIMSLVFENTETMRFQVQEMARVERIIDEEKLQHELDTYNEVIPDSGELSATLLIELDDKEELYKWLPKLVGIQNHIWFVFPSGGRVQCFEPGEERLTREEEVTTTVHYLKFKFPDELADRMDADLVQIVVDHPNYHHTTLLDEEQRRELAGDLLG